MANIKQLPLHEAQKIAAGQVVERPANVVKELLENAIDAGANTISLFIEDGGKQLIRVVDNGCGMDEADAHLCFKKHATSKIKSVDELPSLTTFGFRGEALASIAAVAKVTLLTKEKDAVEGLRVNAQEGNIAVEPTGCPQGTDLTIRDLFYNVPARAKFLKKRETETRHIIQAVQALAFAYPDLHIQLTVDGRQLLNCPAQETMLQRCAQAWDGTTAKHMMAIEATRSDKGISVSGAISNHQWFRYDRSGIFFLVNNRWVTNIQLSRALVKGYNNVIPNGRYPMAAISIIINPALIDVNTHPRKEEITFAHPRTVEQLILQTVRQALEKHVSKQIKKEVSFYQAPAQTTPSASPSFAFKPASFTSIEKDIDIFKSSFVPSAPDTSVAPTATAAPIPTASPAPLPPETTIPIIETADESHTIIGQYAKTYILIEQQDGLFLLDQHAAHERILYEQFAQRFEDLPTINLMFPQLINCSQEDRTLLEAHLDIFKQHGITIEPFSKEQLIIQSTPVHLKNTPLQEIVQQVIGWIREFQNIDKEQFHKKIHDKLRAQMACKAAVKAGDVLTHSQMQELIKDLHETPNRFSCPHGRPTGWMIPLLDIEKKFRRKT